MPEERGPLGEVVVPEEVEGVCAVGRGSSARACALLVPHPAAPQSHHCPGTRGPAAPAFAPRTPGRASPLRRGRRSGPRGPGGAEGRARGAHLSGMSRCWLCSAGPRGPQRRPAAPGGRTGRGTSAGRARGSGAPRPGNPQPAARRRTHRVVREPAQHHGPLEGVAARREARSAGPGSPAPPRTARPPTAARTRRRRGRRGAPRCSAPRPAAPGRPSACRTAGSAWPAPRPPAPRQPPAPPLTSRRPRPPLRAAPAAPRAPAATAPPPWSPPRGTPGARGPEAAGCHGDAPAHPSPSPPATAATQTTCGFRRDLSGVLAQVATAGRALRAALQPLHDVLQVAAMAAALAPHEQALDHVVADGARAGAAVAPAGGRVLVGVGLGLGPP